MYIAVPADAEGVRVEGEWDPLGMRGTVSRTLFLRMYLSPKMDSSCRAGSIRLLRNPSGQKIHMFMTLTPSYVGIAQACYDFTVAYLRGEIRECHL